MIAFRCPRCKIINSVESSLAGTKIDCTSCGQRMIVPAPPPNKTLLGEIVQKPMIVQPPPQPSPVVHAQVAPEPERERDRPARRRNREDDDYDDDRDDDRGRRRRGFRCPFCRSNERPIVRQRISPAGWIAFGVILLFFFPLCWIGLLIKENYQTCYDCGMKMPS